MRLTPRRINYLELFALLIFIILNAGTALLYFYISEGNAFFSIAFYTFFLAFVSIFLVRRGAGSENPDSQALHALFSISAFSYFMSLLTAGGALRGLAVKLIISVQSLGLWLVLFLPLLFFSFAAIYLLKKDRWRNPYPKLVLLAVVFLMLVLYYFIVLQGVFIADDEELLKLVSVTFLIHGMNPYSTSIAQLLYQHTGSIGATLTTTNTFVGTMDYPALFFLTFVPFYFAAQPTIQNLNTVYLPLQFCAFLFILIAVFAYLSKEKQMLKPQLTLIVLFILAATELSSLTAYLMLALMLLAYAKIESRYAWLFLGLCVSIQEELWLPVLFLLAYSLNTQGLRQGMRNALGAVAVFLVFNAAFIAWSPSAYFGSVFAPLNQLIMPFNPSAFSFSMLKYYQLPLTAYPLLFEMLAAFLMLAFLYLNRKELIPFFSLVPFLVLDHILVSYYAFFLFLLLFAVVSASTKRKEGVIERELRRRKRAFFSLVVVATLLIAGFLVLSHSAYQRNFNVSVVNQSVIVNRSTNTTFSNSQLVYRNLTNSTLYLFTFTYSGISAGFSGLLNESIINGSQRCASGNFTCLVNTNRITLNGSSGVYPLHIFMHWSNQSSLVNRAAVVLYNGQYFYVSDSVGNETG